MKYRSLISTVAAALVALTVACDDKSGSSAEDAGPDSKSAESTKKQKQKNAGGKEGGQKRAKARAEESGTLHEEPPPELDGLLKGGDLKKLGGGGSFGTTELPGKDPSPSYNSRRFKPKGGGGYGAGIQVWAFDKAGKAQKRLGELRSQYLNTEDVPKSKRKALGSGAFLSERGGIRNLLFSVDEPPRVSAVSCSVDVCDKKSKVLELAVKVRRRLASRSGSDSGDGGSDKKEGSSGDDSDE